MAGFFTWIRDQRVRLSEFFAVPEQGPTQQPCDDSDTDDVEPSPSALPGPPPLSGRPPTWLDLIRDVLYVKEAQVNFRKASFWLILLLLAASVAVWTVTVGLSALARAVGPNGAPSMLQLAWSVVGLSGVSGGVWWLLRIRARRQGALSNPPPTDPAPIDPTTGSGPQDPGPQGSGTGEPQP